MRKAKPTKFFTKIFGFLSALTVSGRLLTMQRASMSHTLTLHIGKTRVFKQLTWKFWSWLGRVSFGFNHIGGDSLSFRSNGFWLCLSRWTRRILMCDLCERIEERLRIVFRPKLPHFSFRWIHSTTMSLPCIWLRGCVLSARCNSAMYLIASSITCIWKNQVIVSKFVSKFKGIV